MTRQDCRKVEERSLPPFKLWVRLFPVIRWHNGVFAELRYIVPLLPENHPPILSSSMVNIVKFRHSYLYIKRALQEAIPGTQQDWHPGFG